MLQQQAYDLMLCDIRLGDITGIEVLRNAKATHPSTVVVMISAYASTEVAVEAMNLGAYEYLHKPVRLDELRSVMKKIFNGGSIARVS